MIKTIANRERIFYLDQLRALAILLVILCHVLREYTKIRPAGSFGWSCVAIFIDIGVMGVPLFLMISGSLLLNRDYQLGEFIKRRFSRVLIPFIFWGLILPICTSLIYHSDLTSSIKWFIGADYWFIWMLIGVYLFLPIINSFIKEYGMKAAEYFLAIWFFTIILNTFGIYPFHYLELSYFAGFLGFVVLGYYLKNKEFKLNDRYILWIGIILLVTFTIINIHFTLTHFEAGLISNKSLKYYHYETIVVVLQSIGCFLVFEYFAKYSSKHSKTIKNSIYSFFKDTFISKIIYLISVCSYGMYLIHYSYINLFRWVEKSIFPVYTGRSLYFPIIYIIIVTLSFLSIYALSKIPYLKEISGAY